ncbi:hypothetical protein BC827DRAFT_1247746 [Russula dissimulans]|nr:hypothetical protein BC827DRAFT_1247746 [Russula dissimulans]
MVLHHSHLDHGVPTKTSTIYGYLWGRRPCRSITYKFDAQLPIYENTIHPPYMEVERAFFQTGVEVFDTLIRVADHTLLISAYFDTRLDPNPNLRRDFPHIPWRGEIAMLFVGKRKHFVKRAPPDSVVRLALARYMGLCIAHVELGTLFPGYITMFVIHIRHCLELLIIALNLHREGSTISDENILVD